VFETSNRLIERALLKTCVQFCFFFLF